MDEMSLQDGSESGSGMLEENSTWTTSCATSTLQAANGSGLPPDVDIAIRVFQVTFTILRSIFGLMLNGLVVFLIARYRELKNVSFAIAIQIAAVNLLLTGIYSLSVVSNSAGRWILGTDICIATGFLVVMLVHVRDNLILVFALDRFSLVFVPFHYPKYSRRVVIALCASSWLLGLLNSVIVLPPLLDCYKYNAVYLLCNYSQFCNSRCHIYHFVLIITHLAPVIVIPTVCFTALYIKGRKIRRQVTSMTGEGNGRMSDKDLRALKTFIFLLLPSFMASSTALWSVSGNSSTPPAVTYVLYKLGANLVGAVVIADAIVILRNADVREVLHKLVGELKEKFMN